MFCVIRHPLIIAPGGAQRQAPLTERLPIDAGWLLITAGVVGLVVPGVFGIPFLLAGALVLAPGGIKLLSRLVGHSGMRQIGCFLDNLERRYPRRRPGNVQ